MFLSSEERAQMDCADRRFMNYKNKKMDVFAAHGLWCCAWAMGLLGPALMIMYYNNIIAGVFYLISTSFFFIPFLRTAWWFFDDREELKIWRNTKASNPG